MSRLRTSYQKEDGTWLFKWGPLKRTKRHRRAPSKSGWCLDNKQNLYREIEEDGTIQGRLGEEENDI